MRIYKTATSEFLERGKQYFKNERTMSEMKADLENNISAEKSWLGTDREKFATSAILKAKRILDVIETIETGGYIEGIGGQPIVGLAIAWDSMEIAQIREFVTA